MGIENPVHILFVAVIALIVLGPRRLPELARSLGRGVREFREAIGAGAQDHSPHETFGTAAPPPVTPAASAPADAADPTSAGPAGTPPPAG